MIIVIIASGLVGYILGYEKGYKKKGWIVIKKITPQVDKIRLNSPPSLPENTESKVWVVKEKVPVYPGNLPCDEIQRQLLDILSGIYQLRDRYPKQSEVAYLNSLIKTLLSRAPIPSGEVMNSSVFLENIFYLYRMLGRAEISFIKGILKELEGDMEYNMALFFYYLKKGSACKKRYILIPRFKDLYRWAGFFLNTLGGRAYLFRRDLKFRLLMSFYCSLIVHEADLRHQNSYGIDLLPEIQFLVEEISLMDNLTYRDIYVERLREMKNYYLAHREARS